MNNNEENQIKKRKNLKASNRIEDCIYSLGNNLFDVIVQRRINGKVYTKKARKIYGKQNARNKRNQFIADFQRKKDNLYKGGTSWPEVVKEYLEWLERKAHIGKDKGHLPKLSDYNKAKSYLPTYTRFWNSLNIMDITAIHIEKLFERPELQQLASSTQKDVLKYIRAVFKRSLEAGRIPINIARTAYLPKSREDIDKKVIWIRPEVMNKIFDLYHDEEMNQKNKWAVVFYLGYYTGCRSGELYNLRWSDLVEREIINENTGKKEKHFFFHIHSNYNWKLKREGPTKSGHRRYVDVTAIKNYLFSFKLRSSEKEFVFPRDNEWEKGKAARALRQALNEVGFIPEKAKDENGQEIELWPNFHSLRSCYIMNLLMTQKVSLLTVQSIVGHAEYKTTKRYLAQLEPEDIRNTQELLEPFNKKISS